MTDTEETGLFCVGDPPFEAICDHCEGIGPAAYTAELAADLAEKAGWVIECEHTCATCAGREPIHVPDQTPDEAPL